MAQKKDYQAAVLQLAREQYGDENIAIDDQVKCPSCKCLHPAVISDSGPDGDNGAYVQAWVWVDFAGTPFDKNPD